MTIEEIMSLTDANQVVTQLKKKRRHPLPNYEINMGALDPMRHPVNDKSPEGRPDKRVVVDTGDGEGERVRTEKVARVAVALQRLIVNRAVSFTFGQPVKYIANPEDETQQAVLKAFNAIIRDVKGVSHDREVARELFSFQDVAECWYPVRSLTSAYGFSSKYKLKCRVFSPDNGDTLYPYFDDNGDLVAFSRSFVKYDDTDTRQTYFETWTAQAHYLWKSDGGGYSIEEGYPQANPIGKIPIIYAHQCRRETADVDNLIERLEKLLSNFADTNDYHASPKIVVNGHIEGFSRKGETGAVLEVDGDCKPYYLSWSSAPESVKLEVDTLLRMIYTISQTPDISFDTVKGIGAVSGVALKMMFLDAHLKVQDKREILDEFLQRRVSVVKAYIKQLNVAMSEAVDALNIEPQITPYMINDDEKLVQMLNQATGGKVMMSQDTAVRMLGMSVDADAEIGRIKAEESAGTMVDAMNPAE
jgi:SPP1 family phage portal protein